MAAQFLSIPADTGELVVIPRAEYDALLAAASQAAEDAEDAADVAAYDAAKADPGGSQVHPPEISAYLLQGDSLIAAYRKHRGWTQIDLAQEVRVTQGYISDLEKRKRAGSPEVLLAIARALQVNPSALGVSTPNDGGDFEAIGLTPSYNAPPIR